MKQESTAKVLHKASTLKGAQKDVHIIDNNGHVMPDPVYVTMSLGEQVMWIADQDGATITFSPTDCPFDQWRFDVAAGGSAPSGLVKDDAKNKSYKYTVNGSAGQNDPGVIIQN